MDIDKLISAGTGLLQEWGSAAIDAKYRQPFEQRRLAIETLGADGLLYAEGQRGALPYGYGTGGGMGGGAVLLLLGVAAIMLLKD